MIDQQTAPVITPTPDGYKLVWEARGGHIVGTVERLSEHSDGLVAEVSIEYDLAPRPGQLKWGRLDLMAEQTRSRWASALEKRDGDIDWVTVLEQLCRMVKDAYRQGSPEVDLRSYEPQRPSRWLVEPFVESGGPTILFADGGTGKSYAGLAIAVSVASGRAILGTPHVDPCPVLYLDWETDADTAQERLRAIRWGAGITESPPVFYRRMYASLPAAVAEVRRSLFRTKAGFMVVDSLGASRGGEPESADLTIQLFNAARSLGVPWLGIDHVTKSSGNDATKPFGSAYTPNLARLTWSMDKADEDSRSMRVSFTNRKQNNMAHQRSRGYRMSFTRDEEEALVSLTFDETDLPADAELGKRAENGPRIFAYLREGGQLPMAIAQDLEIKGNVVRARLAEMLRRGQVRRDAEGKFWQTAERSN